MNEMAYPIEFVTVRKLLGEILEPLLFLAIKVRSK